MLVVSVLLGLQWRRTRALLQEFHAAKIAFDNKDARLEDRAPAAIERPPEKVGQIASSEEVELSNETQVVELPYGTRRQELEG